LFVFTLGDFQNEGGPARRGGKKEKKEGEVPEIYSPHFPPKERFHRPEEKKKKGGS